MSSDTPSTPNDDSIGGSDQHLKRKLGNRKMSRSRLPLNQDEDEVDFFSRIGQEDANENVDPSLKFMPPRRVSVGNLGNFVSRLRTSLSRDKLASLVQGTATTASDSAENSAGNSDGIHTADADANNAAVINSDHEHFSSEELDIIASGKTEGNATNGSNINIISPAALIANATAKSPTTSKTAAATLFPSSSTTLGVNNSSSRVHLINTNSTQAKLLSQDSLYSDPQLHGTDQQQSYTIVHLIKFIYYKTIYVLGNIGLMTFFLLILIGLASAAVGFVMDYTVSQLIACMLYN